MAAQLLAVEEDFTEIADGTEPQCQIVPLPTGRQGEAALVNGTPERIDQIRKLGLPGLWHMRIAPGATLVPELPGPIERQAHPRRFSRHGGCSIAQVHNLHPKHY
ncbi:hypothetical protein D3C87_1489800 [compost metagenome]